DAAGRLHRGQRLTGSPAPSRDASARSELRTSYRVRKTLSLTSELFQKRDVSPLRMCRAENTKGRAMGHVKVPWESWVVVCDGAKALILQNAGDAEILNLQVRQAFEQRDEPDREIGADKPGRSHQPDGVGGSAVEETSWHEQAEEDFLKE